MLYNFSPEPYRCSMSSSVPWQRFLCVDPATSIEYSPGVEGSQSSAES